MCVVFFLNNSDNFHSWIYDSGLMGLLVIKFTVDRRCPSFQQGTAA